MLPRVMIGTLELSMYWMMFLVGVSSMGLLMFRRRQRYGLSVIQSLVFTAFITFFGLSGTKILGALQNWEEVMEKGLSAAGLSFFGAVFLIPIGMALVARFFRMKKSAALDASAPCLASMVGFMRFGCFFAGCCGGKETEFFGLRFLWPAQALESLGDFLVLAIIMHLEDEKRFEGKQYPVFLVGYGILRFFVEFLRDTEKMALNLGEGQWLALLSVVIGGAILFRTPRNAPEHDNAVGVRR